MWSLNRMHVALSLLLLLPTLHALPFSEPSEDPFYIVPSNISKYNPGAIIRSRQTDTYLTGVTAYELFYRTNNDTNIPDGTVATVWVPAIPANPPRIFSYHEAEDSDNLDCDPSWAWVANTTSNNTAIAHVEGSIVIPWGLSQGAYVVSPDAEGSHSAWLVGRIEGTAALDGIRAVINEFKLSAKNTKVGMYGYSGGGHTTVWAATLAGSYAPELDIVGAAHGGTPVDLLSSYNLLNGGNSSILAGGALIGLANGYPGLNSYLVSQAKPQYKTIAATYREQNFCIPNEASKFENFNFTSLFRTNVLAPKTPLSAVLAHESLLQNVSSFKVPVPIFPRYEYHGTADVTVPYPSEAQYVSQQCSHGADITFVTYDGQDHGEAAINGLPSALGFLGSAFAGTLIKGTCGSPTFTNV